MEKFIKLDRRFYIQELTLYDLHHTAGRIAKLPHGTPTDILIIVLDGMVKCKLTDSSELTLSPDNVTLFVKGQPRVSHYISDTHILMIHIDSHAALASSTVQLPICEMTEFGRECLEKLSADSTVDELSDGFVVTAYICGLLSELARVVKSDVPERFAAIHSAKLLIERDFTSDIPITDYAKSVAMCESTFRRSFTQYVGMSPIQYRLHLRLEFVKLLVSTGECSLSEAGSRAGFGNLPYLCRCFKKKYGVSVSEYLRQSKD